MTIFLSLRVRQRRETKQSVTREVDGLLRSDKSELAMTDMVMNFLRE